MSKKVTCYKRKTDSLDRKTFLSEKFPATYICPVCGKTFVPAPYHAYQINKIPYCTYTCFRKAQREQECD